MANLKLTVFTVDRETGHDDGRCSEAHFIDEYSHEAHFVQLIGTSCMKVVRELRKRGVDAREYDINVRFESTEYGNG